MIQTRIGFRRRCDVDVFIFGEITARKSQQQGALVIRFQPARHPKVIIGDVESLSVDFNIGSVDLHVRQTLDFPKLQLLRVGDIWDPAKYDETN